METVDSKTFSENYLFQVNIFRNNAVLCDITQYCHPVHMYSNAGNNALQNIMETKVNILVEKLPPFD